MGRIAVIKSEIDGDPLTRSYVGMTDIQVANDMNTAYRDAPADQGSLFNYLALEKAREDPAEGLSTHTEGLSTHIYGRLRRAADGVIGTDVFVVGGASLTDNRKDACVTFLQIVDADRLGSITDNLNSTKFGDLLDEVIAAGVMKSGDKTAIVALSQNMQSRGTELGVGVVYEGHVAAARAL